MQSISNLYTVRNMWGIMITTVMLRSSGQKSGSSKVKQDELCIQCVNVSLINGTTRNQARSAAWQEHHQIANTRYGRGQAKDRKRNDTLRQ